jgi:gliding motility-associated-like protein
MNNFLRAQFRHFSVNSIKNKVRSGIGVLCGIVALMAVLSPVSSFADGFGGATVSPTVGSPQLVCSGGHAAITLTPSTPSPCPGFTDWTAKYYVDSSSDGGSTWFIVDSALTGPAPASIVYSSPLLLNTTTICKTLTYRFRLINITNHCSVGTTTYTSPLAAVTVCPQPDPVTGASSVCVGSSITLATTSTGGTWSSSSLPTATVNSSGLVTGIAPGTVTISYTNSSGCSATKVVTVIALPAPITGSSTVCVGSTTTYSLSAAPFGGTWTSGTPAVGSIDATTGVFSGLSVGTTTITNTNAGGCFVIMTVNVSAIPTVFNVTGGGHYCAGSAGVAIALSGSETGTVYQLYNGAATAGGTVSGTGAPLSFGTFTAAGTYSVLATRSGICVLAMSGTVDVVIDPLPAAVTGAGSVCAGSTTTYTTASTGGAWSVSNTFLGTIDATSGVFTGLNPGVDTVRYTDALTGCAAIRSVTVLTTPGAITGSASMCIGTSFTYSATPTGGNWISSNTTVATVGVTTGILNGLTLGTTNLTYTLPGGCQTSIAVSVNSSPSPITGGTSVCVTKDMTLSSSPGGGAWNVGCPGIAVISGSTGILSGTGPGTCAVTYCLPGSCCVTTTITVLPSPGAITGPGIVCQGQTITLGNSVAGGTWSSSVPTNASVISSTGVVTGVALGTAVITYMMPSGCFATKTVTVEAVPAPITGTLTICAGQTSLLSTSSVGGTWSVSNFAIDTIDATGVLTGRTAGTDIVSYSFASGCRATAIVTINAVPAAIGGPDGVCVGSTITLTNATPGGTWMSNLPPFADIDATTGVLTGYLPGTVFINYTLPTGCSTGKSVTVNPLPLPIDGAPVVCVGSTTFLSNASAGGPGTWASSNPAIASVNSITGVVTGNNSGVATITFTLPTGCLTTVAVTVNPLPAAITGFARTCIGFCKTLTDATPGGAWSSLDPLTATITTPGGSLCGVAPGTATISYTLPTGCARVVIATVDPIPAPPTGVLSICVGTTTTLSHTIAGGTWTSSDTIVAKVFLGTGLVTGFTAGTANITYTLASGCTAFATVTVNPVPPANTGTLYMCEGNTTTLSNLYPGGVWSATPASVGTVSPTGVVTGTGAGTVRVSYTLPSSAGCSAVSIVTVYPLPAIIGSVLVCPGVASTLTGSPSGGLWASSPTAIATVGSLSGTVTGVATGTAFITYTLATTCRSITTVTVQPLPSAITGPTQVCVASSITLLNFTTGGGTWSSSLPAVGSINSTTGVLTGISAGVTVITFTATATGCIVTSTVTVNPLPAAITGTTNVCVGSTITLSSASPGGTWTSSGAFASVAPSTGVVTGVAAGVEVITYTLPTGCLTTFSVTVDPLPSPISGALVLCYSYTTLLSSGTPGGVWSISPTSVATIDAGGLVTAVGAGTATVTYTLPGTGCAATAVVTVNPLPGPITGILNICQNDTTTLYDTVAGGSWTSENIYIAVIDPATGLLASVSAGTVMITYTLPTGCYTTAIMTINPTPHPISGPLSVCEGYSVTLFDTTTGGSWSSSNTAIAFIGSATGVVTGISPGVVYITYTLPTSCPRVVQFTVNPNPAAITGLTSICMGDTTILTSATPGGTWSSSNPAVAFIFMPSGQMIGISVGTATITYKMPTGCFAATTVIINPVPTATTITGSRSVCVNDTRTLFNPPFPGGTWTSQFPTIATIDPTLGVYTGVTAGVTNITYTLPTGCDTFIQVTVNPLPAAITGVTSVCVGNTTTLSSATPGGTWSSGVPAIGTIDPTTGVFYGVSPGITLVTYKLTSTGCEITAFVTVNPLPSAIVGPAEMCNGSSSIFSSATSFGAWSGGGIVASVTAITADFDSALVVGLSVGTTYITYTLPTGCFVTAFVDVKPLPGPITGQDTVCVGSTVTLISLPATGTWSSSNPGVGSIDTLTGVLTGVTPGVVTVTYTQTWSIVGCTATYTVTVHPLPTPIMGPVRVCETYSITAVDTTAGGQWSISDTAIATISTTGVITGVSAGSVTITYTLPTGCFVTRVIDVDPLPIVTVTTPSLICKYASTILTATGAGTGGTYVWGPPTGISPLTGPVVTASPTISTTYTVIGTTSFGCADTGSVTVWVDSLLNDISVTGKDSICLGDCSVLMAHGREGTFFNWKPAPGLSCTICDTTTACPTTTTTYNMVAIDSIGCRDSLFFTVSVMKLPVMTVLPNPAIVCNGKTAQLTVTDATATAGYVTKFAWFPNAFISCDTCFNPIMSNTFNLVYRVTGITPFGCQDSLRVPVTVLDSAFNSINRDTVICKGSSAQLYANSFNPDGARSDFYWTNDEITDKYIRNPVVSPSVTTTYSVTITPNVCFPRTLYTTVAVVDRPEINITPAGATVASGTGVPLTASITNEMIILHYAWINDGTLSCDTCYRTVATPSVTTTYTFTATSIYGCTNTKSVTITLACDNTQVFVPNTFTPNGDGMNDRFYVSGKGISTITKFLIYNRWGELVYDRYNIPANDPAYGWDGQYKGVVLPPDVFVYIVEATCNLGETFKYKGDISLVR